MENLLPFIIQSSIAIAVFYAYFYLFLRKSKHFQLNRIYLLSSSIIAVVIPFTAMPIISSEQSQGMITIMLQEVSVVANYNIPAETQASSIITNIYISGVIILLSLFTKKLYTLYKTIQNNSIYKTEKYKLIELTGINTAYSFFNFLFLSKDTKEDPKIIEHELVHIKQSHSLDILVINLIQSILWFNPVVYLYKKAIQENHEYIADNEVIQHHSAGGYLQLLLTKTFRLATPITNQFAQSNLKKRIKMMKKQTNKKYTLVRYISAFALPLAMIFAISSCNETTSKQTNEEDINNVQSVTVTAKKAVTITKKSETSLTSASNEKEQVFTECEDMPEFKGGTSELFKFLSKNIKYPEEAQKQGIEGRVILSFIVEADGSIDEVKVLKSVNKYLDAEAIRVVSSMPSWKPGKQRDKGVRVLFNLPVNFKLN